MGHIIPAGTGFDGHRKLQLNPLAEPVDLPEPENILLEESSPMAG